MVKIFFPILNRNAVITPEIERQLKWTSNATQIGRIANQNVGLNFLLLYFLSGEFNGAWRKINAGDPPARSGKRDHIGAGAAANIKSVAGRVVFYKFK